MAEADVDSPTPDRSRMLIVVAVLVAIVIIPFALWGDQMESAAPRLVQNQAAAWAIAVVGVVLLIADVLLPIPSSVVSITLCLLLGPGWGAAAIFVGMMGAFALGYLVGRLTPVTRLRRWVGPRVWDEVAATAPVARFLWIAASRPVPVLAEVTALFAGTMRLPLAPSLASAGTASLLVAAAYAVIVWLGVHQSSWPIAAFILASALLPAAAWFGCRSMKR